MQIQINDVRLADQRFMVEILAEHFSSLNNCRNKLTLLDLLNMLLLFLSRQPAILVIFWVNYDVFLSLPIAFVLLRDFAYFLLILIHDLTP